MRRRDFIKGLGGGALASNGWLDLVSTGANAETVPPAAIKDPTSPRVAIVPQLPHSGSIQSAVFSNDGKFVISGSDDYTLKLWDVASGRLIRTMAGHSSRVWSVAFSQDGQRALS